MTKTFATRDNAVAQSNAQEGKLGTFGGVYTPSILTILGVIMYLRFGWVVGNVGLLGTMLIVTLSTSITVLTGLSISAIATDRVVKGGGAYYMISRSLGIEVGGAVGIPLFIAQTLSIALYVIGFAESVVQTFPILDGKILALVTAVLVAAVALKSASFAIRAQFFIMAAIALSLISFIFQIHPVQHDSRQTVLAEAELLEYRQVRNSGGQAQIRPVVLTTIKLGEHQWPIELTLTNRDVMGFRMLLGRQAVRDLASARHCVVRRSLALRDRFLVNPGKSFLQSDRH